MLAFQGSPPLTRGIPSVIAMAGHCIRFTPAHAGNTSGQKSALCSMKVHPRSRGEYQDLSEIYVKNWGSPPLTRGIHGTE